MKLVCQVLLTAGVVMSAAVQARAATYNVDIVAGSGSDSVTGTLTTDGATGYLISSDIASFSLTLTNSTGSVGIVDPPAYVNQLSPGVLYATATQLLFYFDGSTGGNFNPAIGTCPICSFFTLSATGSDAGNFSVAIYNSSDGDAQYGTSGATGPQPNTDVIGTIAATPLPPTLVMLLSGFVGLCFFTYRARRKGTAALAVA